ncbi:MAG: CpaF family protein [Candidatus Gastranaerophilales bacterium]|nr:CpaF family protein [Candidatus Gastranaerophilales bacterium]
MSLKDRLNTNNPQKGQNDESGGFINYSVAPLNEELRSLKDKLHSLLIEKVNTTPNWSNLNDDEQKSFIKQFIEFQINSDFRQVPINKAEKERLVKEIIQDAKGFGPLDPLLDDPQVSDILVNGAKNIYIEKNGKLYKTSVVFKDNEHLKNIIERIVSKVGRRIDEKSPMVDARLPDGSRVNAIIPPLAIDGPSLSIRRFKKDAGTIEALLRWGSLSTEMAEVLQAAVTARCNVIISGGTGAGKTTLLNSLSAAIPHNERIITIEDSAELSLKQDHVVRLETRPKNIEGEGEISTKDLVINALRMRPDRIIVGECRGAETLDMLQAMNTGHDGSLSTLHANSPRDALSRLETMVLYSGVELPSKNIKQQIASAINIIIQASRLQDGSRKVTRVSEITGMEESVITMQDIFVWKQTGISDTAVIGMHVSTGVRPEFLKKIERLGIKVNGSVFDSEYKHSYVVRTSGENTAQKSALAKEQTRESIRQNLVRSAYNNQNAGEMDILRRLRRNEHTDS